MTRSERKNIAPCVMGRAPGKWRDVCVCCFRGGCDDLILQFEQVFAQGDGDGFRAVGGAYFREDGREVLLYCVSRDVEHCGDVTVGESSSNRFKDNPLFVGKLRYGGSVSQ